MNHWFGYVVSWGVLLLSLPFLNLKGEKNDNCNYYD